MARKQSRNNKQQASDAKPATQQGSRHNRTQNTQPGKTLLPRLGRYIVERVDPSAPSPPATPPTPQPPRRKATMNNKRKSGDVGRSPSPARRTRARLEQPPWQADVRPGAPAPPRDRVTAEPEPNLRPNAQPFGTSANAIPLGARPSGSGVTSTTAAAPVQGYTPASENRYHEHRQQLHQNRGRPRGMTPRETRYDEHRDSFSHLDDRRNPRYPPGRNDYSQARNLSPHDRHDRYYDRDRRAAPPPPRDYYHGEYDSRPRLRSPRPRHYYEDMRGGYHPGYDYPLDDREYRHPQGYYGGDSYRDSRNRYRSRSPRRSPPHTSLGRRAPDPWPPRDYRRTFRNTYAPNQFNDYAHMGPDLPPQRMAPRDQYSAHNLGEDSCLEDSYHQPNERTVAVHEYGRQTRLSPSAMSPPPTEVMGSVLGETKDTSKESEEKQHEESPPSVGDKPLPAMKKSYWDKYREKRGGV